MLESHTYENDTNFVKLFISLLSETIKNIKL